MTRQSSPHETESHSGIEKIEKNPETSESDHSFEK